MKLPRLAWLFGFSILLVALTRLPFVPPHLFSFDSVNLALALEHFDPTLNQPQPPGYPLFVLEARLLHLLFRTPERTFAALGLLVCGLAVGMLYLLGKRLFSPWAGPWVGMTAAALLFVNPAFWYSSLTSPLRPHLALVSTLVAYCCWRAIQGETRYFYAASLALGLGSGARPELFFFLFPLWAWAAWETRDRKLLARGAFWLGASLLMWLVVLGVASGGPQRMISYFEEYWVVQTQPTSVIFDPTTSWRRAAGRAVIWTGLGTLPWIWTLPFGWKARHSLPDWSRQIAFLSLWFVPGFLFQFAVHIQDPDQALSIIPALCLVGGFCVVAAERSVSANWFPQLEERGVLVWIVLLGNLLLFFGELPVPQRNAVTEFRGLTSASDAALIGTYESSYARVRWIEQMTDLGLKGIATLKSSADRPVVVIWARDGEPAWRKISYYLPEQRLYVLEEQGDTGVRAPEARLYTGSHLVTRFTGPPPFRLSVPKGARLIWVAGANTAASLQTILPLQSFSTLYYIDLPPDAPSMRWGSFELVPE
jgi:hypothetical protein